MTATAFAAHFAAYRNIAKRSAEINFTESGCWEWPTVRYGRVWIDSHKEYIHRLSLMIATGADLGADMCACHACDNPPCCNPAHLFAGTRADNNRDMGAKGRAKVPVHRGMANVHATVTDEEIVAALAEIAAGARVVDVAHRLGVRPATVRTWRRGAVRKEAVEAYRRLAATHGQAVA